jgi:NADPH:quinone reductase
MQAGLAAGDVLLVNGANGGVGTAAVQIGRLVGARVLASIRSEEGRARIAELGAEAVSPGEAHERARDAGGADVILELVGAPNLPENMQALATGGRIAVIGVGAGAKAELNLLALMGKRARIHGSTLRARPLEEKALAARRLEHEVLALFESGELKVPVAESFPLERAADAYERFAGGGKLGKVVLEV